MSLLIRQIKIDLIDMLTDWFQERGQDICCECPCNREESDIGYTSCPCDFDLSECPFFYYNLDEELSNVADRLVEILPEPEYEL